MNMRNFGLAAAFMLAATTSVAAQDLPDKGSSGKAERSPSAAESSGPSKESGSMKGAEESSKGGERAKEGRSAQDSGSDRSSSQEGKQQKQSDRSSGESKKSSSDASKADQGHDKSAQDGKKRDDKAADSKSDSSRDKSAAESKSDKDKSTADRGKQDDKGRDSSSGTSSGEAGSDNSGKLTESKKKIDEVKKVQVSGERRDRVQSAFKSHGDIKHETNVDVNISVGSRAPRSWAFAPVPVAVIEVVPEYRGYVFAYAGDDYVICDPDTYEVVAVLPASGPGSTQASGGGSAKCSTSLTLNDEDREAVIRSVEIRNEVNIGGVSVGFSVPGDVELHSFPSTVVERRSELSGCRYFITNDQIAIVDPDQDKVVLLIEQK